MNQKRKKTRSAASYRAASLKGARTKQRMVKTRALTPEQQQHFGYLASQFTEYLQPDTVIGHGASTIIRRMIRERKLKTIDLLPKVRWP